MKLFVENERVELSWQKNRPGGTPLIAAVNTEIDSEDKSTIEQKLKADRVDVNLSDVGGSTPLMSALYDDDTFNS